MTLLVTNWDIEKSVLLDVYTKSDSILGKSFSLPSLGYVAGDILSLNFWQDDEGRLRPKKDGAWFALIRNDIRYCNIAKSSTDWEDTENETQISGTILAILRKFFDLVANRPEHVNFHNFELFLSYPALQIPEPIPKKRLVIKNFWTGEEDRADIAKWYETIDAFDRNEGKDFFDTLERNKSSIDLHCNYDICGLADLALVSVYLTLRAGKALVPCAHCGRLFPPSRVGEIYCSRITPNGKHQTCKEAAKYEKQLKRERASESGKIYKSVNTMLSARVNFAKDESEEVARKKELEDFRDKAREWRSDVKQGHKTEEEYIAWMNTFKKRGNKNRPQC